MTMTSHSQPRPAGAGFGKPSVPAIQAGAKIEGQVQVKRTGYLTEQEILLDASIEAKPFYMPNTLDITIKNYDNVYRWVNRKGSDAMLHTRARGLGFTNATLEDVDLVNPDASTMDGGSIVSQDCVLMKIPCQRYYQALKANMLKAQNATAKYKKEAKSAAAPAEQTGLASVYQPDEAKIKGIVDAAIAEREAATVKAASGQ